MADDEIEERIRAITVFKSKLIQTAESYAARGLVQLARPFYIEAADYELRLAALFDSADRPADANISRFSGACCLVQAGRFSSASPILRPLADEWPEAKQVLAECEGKDDEPIGEEPAELKALIRLLKRKGLITETEWRDTLEEVSAGPAPGARPVS